MKLSVIIPAVNEEGCIARSISSALACSPLEILVIDGESKDRTAEISKAMGAQVIKSRVRGRAVQMNLGAHVAKGDVLLFLHADTILPQNYMDAISHAISNHHQWGFFSFGLDAAGLCFRLLEMGVAIRSRIFGLSYGDQAMFVTTDFFKQIGRFNEQTALEDLDFLFRARRMAKPCLLREQILTSARRWQQNGFFRVTLQHQIQLIRFLLGIR